jgi:hypothetical protein
MEGDGRGVETGGEAAHNDNCMAVDRGFGGALEGEKMEK